MKRDLKVISNAVKVAHESAIRYSNLTGKLANLPNAYSYYYFCNLEYKNTPQ